MLSLRLRTPNGSKSVKLDKDATLHQLALAACDPDSSSLHSLELRAGFPPKLLPTPSGEQADASLESLGVRSGDTITISLSASSSSSTAAASAGAGAATARSAASPAPPAPASRQPPAQDRTTTNPAQSPQGTYVQTPDGGYLTLRVVPDDNSCLFTAVGLLLERSKGSKAPAYLRQVVAEEIAKDPITYSDAMLGRPANEYCAAIRKEATWGGAIELSVFSSHYRVRICSLDVMTGRADLFGSEAGYESTIIVMYSGIHYDAVSLAWAPPSPDEGFPPLTIDFDTTVFSGSDAQEGAVKAAQALADKLRKQHYFTDTATFTLKCDVCKEGLTGERQAREHAEKTGHTRFGEY